MLKRILSAMLCMQLAVVPVLPAGAEGETARQVEYLGRGGYGVLTNDGVYLSWRLLGTEPMDQSFDIYRNDTLIKPDIDNLNYTDPEGSEEDTYRVVPHNGEGFENDVFKPFTRAYKDILLDKPQGGITPAGEAYTYAAGGASAADVDNDGEYEFIIQWDPGNQKDNGDPGYTGNVYLDCYKQNGKKLWRIDMGINIRAGAHYTQFIVYDFDGDGKAEMAVRTAPGSKDGTGRYVSEAGAPIDGEDLLWTDADTGEKFTDESDLRGTSGMTEGKIIKGPDWLTMFNGETGEAMQTVNYYPQRGKMSSWGDSGANRSERYLACAAYLDGVNPSLIMSRGYYERAAMAAYDWDGKGFSLRWSRDDTEKNQNLYSNGNHQISVCDADNDGRDELVFGSTVVDDDGSILNSTDHGHGDALHVSDFDNDGEQEIFQVHEEAEYYKEYGAELRKASDSTILAKAGASDDVGRGLIGNFDDNKENSEFFTSADNNVYNMNGDIIGTKPNVNPSFLVWWDGDLSRELLNRTNVIKYDVESSKRTDTGFAGVLAINKDAPCLSADLFGDWREEVCYATEDNETLRIFMTTDPTEYKIPTLMHDTQYRTAVAWQNVGYHQPPHPKFFVGKNALSENGRYLIPKAGYDAVAPAGDAPVFSTPEPDDEEKGPFTIKVMTSGDIRRTLRTYENCKYMSSISYTIPKYIVTDGTAYEAARVSTTTHYGGSIANVVKDQTIELKYTKKYSNVVYFEDIDEDTGKGADARASNGLARNSGQYTSAYKLQPGKSYTIVVGMNNAGRGSKLMAGENTLITMDGSGGAWADHTFTGVTVDEESPLYTVAGGAQTYDPIDTILIMEEIPDEERIEKLDLTSLDKAMLEITGASEVTADRAVMPGLKNDKGTLSPKSYLTFTAPANGTLTFMFETSAVKDKGNMPRIYYSRELASANKNNGTMLAQASGANLPVHASLNVEKGTTYYLFGYLYNMTSDFTYTLSDFGFEKSSASIAFGDIELTDNSSKVLVNVRDGIADIDVYTAVYDGNGRLVSVKKESAEVDGAKDFVSEFSAGNSAALYIWNKKMEPYVEKVTR